MLATTAVMVVATSALHADTVTASSTVRVYNFAPDTRDAGALSLYNDGAGNIQRSWLNFDLSAYSGKALTTDVTMTLQAGIFGNSLTGVQLGTANTSWSADTITWNNAPSLTTVQGVTNPTIGASSGPITWTIPWYIVEKWATAGYNGIGLTSGAGSTQHFYSLADGNSANHPTLTFTSTTGASGTWFGGSGNWTDTANWASSTVAQGINRSATIDGGTAVTVTMDANRSIGSLSFANADHVINGIGKLALVSSSGIPSVTVAGGTNATISAAIVGVDGLEKFGAGTLTLSGSLSYKGGTVVSNGTLALPDGDWHTGAPWSGDGATGPITVGSGATLSTSSGVTEIKNGITLNGGTVSSRGLFYGPDTWGNLFLSSNITAGGAAVSSITSQITLTGTRTMSVETGSTLNLSGKVTDWNHPNSGITKTGAGTLTLSGANTFRGKTDINAGTLVVTNSAALGESGWSGTNMTQVYNGATLALQGNVSINDHMHVVGAGVGGLGAIRSISGNNALTIYQAGGSSGPGYAIDGNTTIGVDADTLTVTGFYQDGGSYDITKVGDGTLTLSSSSTYTGATLVTAGTLLVNGELGNTAVTVGSNGTIGGSGLIAGSLHFDGNAKLTVNLADPLAINGAVTFANFGFDDLIGFDVQSVAEGTYTLLSGSNFNFANVANYGEGNAFVRNDGKLAYFQNGSLQVVVIPEPRAALLGGIGMLLLLRRRRA